MLTGREKCENNVKESSTAVDQLELMEWNVDHCMRKVLGNGWLESGGWVPLIARDVRKISRVSCSSGAWMS